MESSKDKIKEPNQQEGTSSFSGSIKLKTAIAFSAPENRSKNRSSDVPCWDHSRVILLNNIFGHHSSSNYIHANWIDGYKKRNELIATQAPMQNTVDDFLDMVIQNGCRYIIVMTAIMEDGMEKCYPYWPMENNEICMYDRWFIKLDAKYSENGYTKYSLKIINKKVSRVRQNVTLYNYTNWPENSPRRCVEEYDNFVHTVRADMNDHRHSNHRQEPPIIVHGCLGIDRTIHYCVFHKLLDMMAENKGDISDEAIEEIVTSVTSMRYTRTGQ